MSKLYSLKTIIVLLLVVYSSAAQSQICTEDELSKRAAVYTQAEADRQEPKEFTFYNSRRLLRANRMIEQILTELRGQTVLQGIVDHIEFQKSQLGYPLFKAWDDPKITSNKIELLVLEVLKSLTSHPGAFVISTARRSELYGYLRDLRNPQIFIPDYQCN